MTGRENELRIVSYNLRYATADDGHPWSSRRPAMVELLTELAPDVLGTQEGLAFALADLADGLPGRYGWVGRGRDARPDDGEFCAVFYDTTRFDLVRVRHHWLSDTPEVAGSRSWGNELPRMVTQVSLLDRRADRRLEVLNTHLDNESHEARLRSVQLITGLVGPLLAEGRAVLLTGDFNALADVSPEYAALAASPLRDAVTGAAEVGTLPCSCPEYLPPAPDGDRIDWVFASPELSALRARVVDQAPGGVYPSDHLPVLVDLDWPVPAR